MAGLEVIGFPFWAQPAHPVSNPRSVPLPVAHPPPIAASNRVYLPNPGRHATPEEMCVSTFLRTAEPVAVAPPKGYLSCRKHI
jgi:hypothetical protein